MTWVSLKDPNLAFEYVDFQDIHSPDREGLAEGICPPQTFGNRLFYRLSARIALVALGW